MANDMMHSPAVQKTIYYKEDWLLIKSIWFWLFLCLVVLPLEIEQPHSQVILILEFSFIVSLFLSLYSLLYSFDLSLLLSRYSFCISLILSLFLSRYSFFVSLILSLFFSWYSLLFWIITPEKNVLARNGNRAY